MDRDLFALLIVLGVAVVLVLVRFVLNVTGTSVHIRGRATSGFTIHSKESKRRQEFLHDQFMNQQKNFEREVEELTAVFSKKQSLPFDNFRPKRIDKEIYLLKKELSRPRKKK